MDPGETQERAISKQAKEPWNGEFYVSFGHDYNRHWDDAKKYGFVAGGYGLWYSNTLSMLSEGDRVWVNVPKTGYVAVGVVTGEKTRLEAYPFPEHGGKTLIELDTAGDYSECASLDDDTAQYLVPVKWEKTLPLTAAFSEVGLFGNQNTVCKPRAAKWVHTVERLKQQWAID
ncbi:hypothetical protein [Enterovibrio sp. 27052020O]|uniref:hypothetical protein n=1 Tax=Enterovibrio sp. 27052020O TaxID=3241166 RepID=UPI00388FBEAA